MRICGRLDLHGVTVGQAVRGIDDDLIAFGKTLNLQSVSKIPIDLNLANGNLAVGSDNPNRRTFPSKKQHILRHEQRLQRALQFKMNGSVCAREKFFIRIGNRQLREKRACGGVDGARRRNDFCWELGSRESIEP